MYLYTQDNTLAQPRNAADPDAALVFLRKKGFTGVEIERQPTGTSARKIRVVSTFEFALK